MRALTLAVAALGDLIFLNTTAGSSLMKTASHGDAFWALAPHFTTELPGMCGLATAAMVLNALGYRGLPVPTSPEYPGAEHSV